MFYSYPNKTIKRLGRGLNILVEEFGIRKGALLSFVKDPNEEDMFSLFISYPLVHV